MGYTWGAPPPQKPKKGSNLPSVDNGIKNATSSAEGLSAFLGVQATPQISENKVDTPTSTKKKPETTTETTIPAKETSINEIVISEQGMTEDEYVNLILEEIGGMELLNIARHDTLTGSVAPKYSPIQNIGVSLINNSSVNISPNPNSVTSHYDTYPMFLSFYLPSDEELLVEYPNDLNKRAYVYYDSVSNSIVINAASIFREEDIEVEFLSFDSMNSDTIY